MTVEMTRLFKAIEDATKVEGYRRSQTECSLVEYRLPYRMGFFDGAQWALEQGIVQEMVAALEAAIPIVHYWELLRGHGKVDGPLEVHHVETLDAYARALASALALYRVKEGEDD